MSLKVGIFGITGRMGRSIHDIAVQFPDLKIIGGTSRAPESISPMDLAEKSDVLLDFSTPLCLDSHVQACLEEQKPLLIGTTGLSESHLKTIQKAAEHIPILLAPNTSLGITILAHLVQKAAEQLDFSYDIEIFETHHRNKADAPSGTALMLGQRAAQGRHQQPSSHIRQNGERKPGEIGYAVHRGGGVFGEHSVRFLGDDEIIELKHTALSRHLFARGALKAVSKLATKQPGYYTPTEIFL
jgi:4-hydroxy-tetrahydrodipicolinate reductase